MVTSTSKSIGAFISLLICAEKSTVWVPRLRRNEKSMVGCNRATRMAESVKTEAPSGPVAVGETMLLHAMAAAGNYYKSHQKACLTMITQEGVRVTDIANSGFPPAYRKKIGEDMDKDMEDGSQKFLWFGHTHDGRIHMFKVKLEDCEAAIEMEYVTDGGNE